MAIERPELWKLGGEEAFGAYSAAFDGYYRREPVRDVMGRLVEFPAVACRHVCFIPPESDPKGPRTVWSPQRAARLPWIRAVVASESVEIRPSHREPGTEAYLVRVKAAVQGEAEEMYLVYVRPSDSERVTFLTAFGPDLTYWQAAMRGGRIYPAREPKPKKHKIRQRR